VNEIMLTNKKVSKQNTKLLPDLIITEVIFKANAHSVKRTKTYVRNVMRKLRKFKCNTKNCEFPF
jgi:hypothetical protein